MILCKGWLIFLEVFDVVFERYMNENVGVLVLGLESF